MQTDAEKKAHDNVIIADAAKVAADLALKQQQDINTQAASERAKVLATTNLALTNAQNALRTVQKQKHDADVDVKQKPRDFCYCKTNKEWEMQHLQIKQLLWQLPPRRTKCYKIKQFWMQQMRDIALQPNVPKY